MRESLLFPFFLLTSILSLSSPFIFPLNRPKSFSLRIANENDVDINEASDRWETVTDDNCEIVERIRQHHGWITDPNILPNPLTPPSPPNGRTTTSPKPSSSYTPTPKPPPQLLASRITKLLNSGGFPPPPQPPTPINLSNLRVSSTLSGTLTYYYFIQTLTEPEKECFEELIDLGKAYGVGKYALERKREDFPKGIAVLACLKRKQTKSSAFKLLCDLKIWTVHEDLSLLTSKYPMFHEPWGGGKVFDPDEVLKGRKDLRYLKVYTIDGSNAVEIDDGITYEALPSGLKRVWIHIADATNYASPDVFKNAKKRGTSLYLPTHALQMFPSALSVQMSLTPSRDCRALSACIEVDEFGAVSNINVMSSWVRVQYKLTFEEVEEMIDEGIAFNEEWQIGSLLKLARLRLNHRLSNNSTESRITTPLPSGMPIVKQDRLSKDGFQVGVKLEPNPSPVSGEEKSKLIVTELMILANEAMGIYAENNNITVPYRTQKVPEYRDRQVEYTTLKNLKEADLHLPAAWYERRFFEPAVIKTTPSPHSGLGVKRYVQWTSPIRRFSDIEVHSAVKRFLRVKAVEKILDDGGFIPLSIRGLDLGCVMTGVEDDVDVLVDEFEEGGEEEVGDKKGMIEEARVITRLSRKYWILEYILRTGTEHYENYGKTKVWDLMCLGRIEAGSVCYVKEIGYEFVWNGGEFEIGEEFKGYVKTVEPRMGKVEWAEAVL
ncbi:hypothetical protein TrLO_g1436 [Triparma laevis f. longispina]|uniref:DIS3-like exonuclease 1 n=1 Tax=Triparma laevis f. longispina TaxID=1714387 RepID=A0A9W7KYH3_9STRA|nr:hypothetical protein TrLO_g1436 [Triparma laevis f. longispina]